MSSHPHTITGIDIGNAQVKVVIAKIDPASQRPEIIGVGSHSSTSGLRNGGIVDIKETVQNVAHALQEAENMAGIKIHRAYVGVSGPHINMQVSRGVVGVARTDGEIVATDVDRVLKAASVVSLPQNREVIYTKPRQFVIDGTQVVKDPIGMKGVRLEADVLIIDGPSQHLKYIAKCVNECGIEVAQFVYAPLAAALATVDKHQKEYGVMSLDFGGGTSSMTVFSEADLVHSTVIPVGSRHITHDLAILLRTSIENAERIKMELCSTSDQVDARSREKIDLSSYLDGEPISLTRTQLVKVVDARVQELLEMVELELQKAKKDGMLPAGVVLSGGGSNLPGFAALVRSKLGLPVRLAKPLHIDVVLDRAVDPSFAVSIGLVLWGVGHESTEDGRGGTFEKNPLQGTLAAVTRWIKAFIP